MNGFNENYCVDFDKAIEMYSDMIYRICMAITGNPEDSKDAFQETFLRLVRHHKEITGEEHLKAWLSRVASNCAKTMVTNPWNKRTQGFAKNINQEPVYHQKDNSLFLELKELPYKYSLVLYLFYYEGYSVKEIGDILEKKENSVKTLLNRGRKLLKNRLEGGKDDEK